VSLDTKYRPLRYGDVLGQDATVKVCKEYVRSGHGFRQSYVFAGAHGGGKTTCGRILARALLCENPQNGEPCDDCTSCKAMLADKSENFIEVDAATNSGKEDVKRITQEAQFGSFSGKRKIYLFDECHELSRQAMDALLKPLEDNIRGTQDKQLVCIFCTTEPEKMRSAILSRCAPLFRIRQNTPEEIGTRLAYICDHEGIEYDPEVLPLIAEVCECHVRDSIKAIEGVSMLGRVDRANVTAYLRMDANALYLDLLEKIGFDLAGVLEVVSALDEKVSPATCYEKMADVCMLAYRLANFSSGSVPSYWDRDRLVEVGKKHREFLVEFAQRFAERPAHSSSAMFACDVSALHQRRAGIVVVAESQQVSVAPSPTAPAAPQPPPAQPAPSPAAAPSFQAFASEGAPAHVDPQVSRSGEAGREEISPQAIEPSPSVAPQNVPSEVKRPESAGKVTTDPFVTKGGVYVHPLARNTSTGQASRPTTGPLPAMNVAVFAEILQRRVIELTEEKSSSGRPARLNDLGSS
jgi:DNA polymerase III subunit gamma/tau